MYVVFFSFHFVKSPDVLFLHEANSTMQHDGKHTNNWAILSVRASEKSNMIEVEHCKYALKIVL